jgi:hypothetical protein
VYDSLVEDLPSEAIMKRLVAGDWGALPDAAIFTAARAILISVPFVILKVEPKKVIWGSLLASLLIEGFVWVTVLNEGASS